MKQERLVGSDMTVERLKRLLLNDHKDDQLTPLDLLIVSYLLIRHTEDNAVTDSWDTIAGRLHVNRKTVGDSLARLEPLGWIIRTDRYAFDEKQQRRTSFRKASLTSVNPDALPDGKTPHLKPSADAQKLAAEYHAIMLPQIGVTKKRSRQWHRMNEYAAQQILDAFSGNLEDALDHVDFAVIESTFAKSARDSLREIKTRLPKLKREVKACIEETRAGRANQQIETSQPE